MDQLFQDTLRVMESAFEVLEQRVPKPQRKALKGGFVFRYIEQSAHQALIQKLARVITGLHAAKILLEHGFVQEQAALQRILDEFQEDILFLVYGLTIDKLTELHQRYLPHFTRRSLTILTTQSGQLRNDRWFLARRFRHI